MGDRVDEDGRERGVATDDGSGPAEERGLQEQPPSVQSQLPVDGVVRLQHGGTPADHRRQGGQEFVRAAVQQGTAPDGAVGLDARPDVRPVRLHRGTVVGAQSGDETPQRLRAPLGERLRQRGPGRGSGGRPAREGGLCRQQPDLGTDPVHRGVAQRLHSGVQSEWLRTPLRRCQEVGEIAAGWNDGGQQACFTIQPGSGFLPPFPEHGGTPPVPQPVETENGFPHRVRPRGHPHARKVHPGHMDTQHRTPTCCTRNCPRRSVCAASQEVTTGFRPQLKCLARIPATRKAVRRRVRYRSHRRAGEGRGGLCPFGGGERWCGSAPGRGKRVRPGGGDPRAAPRPYVPDLRTER
ncbi:hypothetical protein F750_2338 [Streptomyces sp. PAMC 26508]|nr:hypothetical protein F750_2338 [Streptomyces sp. PAMC 26508]